MVLLAPRLADRTGVLVCLVSALLSVLGALYLPGKWYIIIAAVAATLAGGFIEGRRKK
jgi:predicted branched-subunit amino acid permease